MSFEDLEAGTRPRAPLPLSEVAEYAVSQIKTKVGALRHHGDMLGTPRDTPALRSRIRVTRAEALRLAKITSQKLSQAAADDNSADATQRIAPDAMSKLAKNFEATLRDFQHVLHRIVAAERQIISASAAGTAAAAGTSAEQLQQPLLATGREDHEAFVSERELTILEAEHGIAQIDDMLRNLATLLVGDQGGSSSVDHVVCDIERIAQQTTSQAADEKISGMVKAPVATGKVETPVATTRSSARCLLMFVLALFLLILFLVIVGR